MHERGPVPIAAILRGAAKGGVAGNRVSAIDFFKMEIREAGDEPGNTAPGSLHFHRNGDRVTVIFHAKDHRQLAQRRFTAAVRSRRAQAFTRVAAAEAA